MINKKLIELHEKNSKHSNYQILPNVLKAVLQENDLTIKTRYENERLSYFLSKINFARKSVLDIGANAGFFSFESVDAGATEVTVFEGNKHHADFVELANKAINYPIKVNSRYYSFEKNTKSFFDIVLLLNIVHHFGDDYGDKSVDKGHAKVKMIECINNLSYNCEHMIFQMGFNWKGNRYDCLFENGTKKEMIEFIENGTNEHWIIENIGVAEREGGGVVYNDLNNTNIQRDDGLGEFLNRPIIILKSKKHNG